MSASSDFIRYIVEAIESDGNVYRQQYRPIVLNLARKKIRGIYEREKAINLVIYLVETGIKKHKADFCRYYEIPAGSLKYARISAAIKKAIAVRLLQDMTPEITYAVREMKAAKTKTPAKRRR